MSYPKPTIQPHVVSATLFSLVAGLRIETQPVEDKGEEDDKKSVKSEKPTKKEEKIESSDKADDQAQRRRPVLLQGQQESRAPVSQPLLSLQPPSLPPLFLQRRLAPRARHRLRPRPMALATR